MTSHLHPECTCTLACPVHAVIPAARWAALRDMLTSTAAIEQELGREYSAMGTPASLGTAHRHWGHAQALRDVLAWMDREDRS